MKKKTIIIVLLVLLVAYVLLGKKGLPGGLLGDSTKPFNFDAYRSARGAWGASAEENGMWGAMAKIYNLDKSDPAQNAEINSLYNSVKAFHKAYDIQPNGFHFRANPKLIGEFNEFLIDAGGSATESMVSVGEYL